MRRVLLILTLAFPALLFAQMPQQEDVIRLQSTGEIDIEPNLAIVKIAVATEQQTVGEAIAENADKMNQVVTVLQNAIEDPNKIQTSRFQVNPVNQYDQETRRSYITAYRVTNEVTIEYDDLENLGSLLDSVTNVGSNQIQQLSYSHSDIDILRDKARQKAILKGMDQAKMMADVAGVEMARIVEISTFTPQSGPMPMYAERALASDAGTTILPGEMTVSQQVTMVFAIN